MSDLDDRDAGDAIDLLGSGIATVAGASGGAQVGKEAAQGAAIGAAVGTVLEAVPVAGPILHAIAIAAGAIGGAISGALRDTYHPSPLQAGICALLCRVAPGMIYAGFDTINTETKNAAAYACRLVRYWRLLAGLVPNAGPLYNPRNDGYRAHNLPTDTLQKNAYIESATPDPQEALTDVRVTRHLRELVVHYGHQPAAPEIPPLVRTQADAQAILPSLRAHLAQSGVLDWDPIKTNLRGLRIAVGKVMTIAGETKPDPVLSNLLGGVVRPQALRGRDHGTHAPAAARRPAARHRHPARPAAPPHARPAAHPAAHVDVNDPFTELRARAGLGADPVPTGAPRAGLGADPVPIGTRWAGLGADPVPSGTRWVGLGADPVPSGAPPAAHGRPGSSPASGSDPFAARGRAPGETAAPVLDLDADGAAEPDQTQSSNAFALDLYAKTRVQPGNLALSPLSIATALAMALAGARGSTAWQMERVLHVGGSTRREIGAAGELLATYSAPRQDVILRIANRLFGDSAYRFEQPFLDLTRVVFDAPLEPVDFRSAPREARERINAWVERQTQARIKDLIPVGALDPLTRLVLVNAVYFLGDWLTPFEPHATRTEAFQTPGGAKDVPMMHRTGRYRFTTADGLKVLEMPYCGGDLAMVLLLPDEAAGTGAVEARLSPEGLGTWLDALVHTRVAVSLPKFLLEPGALALGDMLSAMGMPLAFDAARADFTGIANPPSSGERIHLSAVFHRAFVKVDERGTEAAAATGVVMAARGISVERKPSEFKADHPFLFVIRDVRSGLILFMGRVCDPGENAGNGGDTGAVPSSQTIVLRDDTGDASYAWTLYRPGWRPKGVAFNARDPRHAAARSAWPAEKKTPDLFLAFGCLKGSTGDQTGWYLDGSRPERGAYYSEAMVDIPEITPASGPDRGRVHGFPIDPENWSKGIESGGETGSYEEIARPLREDAQAARELWARAKVALGDTQVGRWLLGPPVQAGDAKSNADTGDIFDDLYGSAFLVRLQPFLFRAGLQAVPPGWPPPAPEERVFVWNDSWDTREAFATAFGEKLGKRLHRLALARGWRFVSVALAPQEVGDPDAHAGRLIRLLPAVLQARRERGESTAPLSNCVIRPEEIAAAEARLGAEAAGVTDVGRQRKQNQDCLLLRPDLALFCVADGMGGHNAGDVASERVTTALAKHFEATTLGPVYDELHDEYASLSPGARRLAAGVVEANRDVHALSKTHPQHRGMGSTCVALHLAEGMAHVAHVGDSRCYRIRNGELVQMTRDHSLINEARDMKPDLTDEDLARLPKNIITRALGTKDVVKVDVQSDPTLPGDIYLLCSDGLTGMLPDEEILNVIRSAEDAQEACERLIAQANARGGTDNISALVVRIGRDRELGPAECDARTARARERAAALLLRLVDGEDVDGAGEDVGALGPGRGRLYAPPAHQQEDSGHREPGREPRAQAVFPGLVLVHGVTPQGIDTPGVVRLAKALAACGLTVLTPEIPALAGGRLDPRAVDSIAQAVLALADRSGAPVGLVGLSIGGGLSLLAAAKARCADSLSFVCTIGAHHDLGRVARFSLTNRVEQIDEGGHRLEADPAGRRMLADVLLDGANEPPSDLGAALVEAREALAALSPAGRLGDLSVPVFVLHGAEDNLIPAAEAEWIARELPVGMLRRQLVTPALSHVDVGALGEVGADETAALVAFLADLLAHAETMAAPFTGPEDPHQGETMYYASAPSQALPTGAPPAEAGTVFDDAAARANQAVEEARAYLSETWLGKALGIEPEPKPPRTTDPGFELYSAGQPLVLPREGDASAPGNSDAGGLLDFIFDPEARDAERLRQREALKKIPWVKDGALGTFLNLDEPAPLPAPAPRPHPLVLVPEAAGEAGAPPKSMDADAVRRAILAAPPQAVPPAWKALDAPAQLYWWDPFGETWARMGDGRDREVAKVLAVFFLKETHFPVSYCLLHSSEGSEVIRAEKNASQDPPAGEGPRADWRPDKAGVSHLWILAYTFYARSFPPGETVRFDFAGPAGGGREAGAPAGWKPTHLPETGASFMPPGEASEPLAPREDANGKKDYRILRNLAWPRLLAWLAEHPIPEADPVVAIWKRFETDWEAGDERPYEIGAQWENFDKASNLAAARGYLEGVGLNEDAPREGARRLAFVRPMSPDGGAAAPISAASEGDTGYPARPSLAALCKLEEELDAAWPGRRKKWGGNISDASADRDRGVLDVPESPAGYGPALAYVQAAVKRDARVVETEIVTPALWNSVRVPTLRIFTAEGGADASPWDLSATATGPSWENYGRRSAAGDTSDPFFAELDACGRGDLGEASGLDTGTRRWQDTMSQGAGVHASPTYNSPRVAEIAAGTPVRVVGHAVDDFVNEWASIEWAPGFGRRGDGWVRASLLGGYDTAGEAGDVEDEAGRLPEFTDERLLEAAPRVLALLGDVAGAMKLLRAVQGIGPVTGLNRFQQKVLDAINGTALDDGAGAITEVYALLGRDRGSAAVLNALRGLPPGKALTRFGRRVLAVLTGEVVLGPRAGDETGAPRWQEAMAQTSLLYATPSYHAEVVGEVLDGTPVNTLERVDGWSRIAFGGERDGWVPTHRIGGYEVDDEPAEGDVALEDFEAPLSHYGTWIDDPRFGRIWQPANDIAGAEFSPYASDGSWVANEDGGWVFQSTWDDAFAWATYHYGRWVDHPELGWVWTPGTEWAPSWVEWRHGGGYVGYVPMGPEGYVLPEHRWVFVDERRFADPGGVWRYRVPRERIHTVYLNAVPIVRRAGVRWSYGPPVERIRAAGGVVRQLRLAVPTRAAVRVQASVAVRRAITTARPAPAASGSALASVRRGPRAGTTTTVAARPPAPSPVHAPPPASSSAPPAAPAQPAAPAHPAALAHPPYPLTLAHSPATPVAVAASHVGVQGHPLTLAGTPPRAAAGASPTAAPHAAAAAPPPSPPAPKVAPVAPPSAKPWPGKAKDTGNLEEHEASDPFALDLGATGSRPRRSAR